jgi:hypothetical protein
MDPLMIAGACCERVDAGLVDRNPVGDAELLANPFAQLRKGEIAHVFPP